MPLLVFLCPFLRASEAGGPILPPTIPARSVPVAASPHPPLCVYQCGLPSASPAELGYVSARGFQRPGPSGVVPVADRHTRDKCQNGLRESRSVPLPIPRHAPFDFPGRSPRAHRIVRQHPVAAGHATRQPDLPGPGQFLRYLAPTSRGSLRPGGGIAPPWPSRLVPWPQARDCQGSRQYEGYRVQVSLGFLALGGGIAPPCPSLLVPWPQPRDCQGLQQHQGCRVQVSLGFLALGGGIAPPWPSLLVRWPQARDCQSLGQEQGYRVPVSLGFLALGGGIARPWPSLLVH